VIAEILRDDQVMQKVRERLGFCLEHVPEDDVVRAEIEL
jgi:hypothetical protein